MMMPTSRQVLLLIYLVLLRSGWGRRRPRRKLRRASVKVSPYPKPPRELAGMWVAWSRRRIVASGDTLAGVIAAVERDGIEGASYEKLPPLDKPPEEPALQKFKERPEAMKEQKTRIIRGGRDRNPPS